MVESTQEETVSPPKATPPKKKLSLPLADEKAFYPPRQMDNYVTKMFNIPPQQMKHLLDKYKANPNSVDSEERKLIMSYQMQEMKQQQLDEAFEKDPFDLHPDEGFGGLGMAFGDFNGFGDEGLEILRPEDWRFPDIDPRTKKETRPARSAKNREKQGMYEMHRCMLVGTASSLFGNSHQNFQRAEVFAKYIKAKNMLEIEKKALEQKKLKKEMPHQFRTALEKIKSNLNRDLEEVRERAEEMDREDNDFDFDPETRVHARAGKEESELKRTTMAQFPSDVILFLTLSSRESGFATEIPQNERILNRLVNEEIFGDVADIVKHNDSDSEKIKLGTRLIYAKSVFDKCVDIYYLFQAHRQEGGDMELGQRMACEYCWECYNELGVTIENEQKYMIDEDNGLDFDDFGYNIFNATDENAKVMSDLTGVEEILAQDLVEKSELISSPSSAKKQKLLETKTDSESKSPKNNENTESDSTTKNLKACVACGKKSSNMSSFTSPHAPGVSFAVCDRECQRVFWKAHKKDHTIMTLVKDRKQFKVKMAKRYYDNDEYPCEKDGQPLSSKFLTKEEQKAEKEKSTLADNLKTLRTQVRRALKSMKDKGKSNKEKNEKKIPPTSTPILPNIAKIALLKDRTIWQLQLEPRALRYEWLLNAYRVRSHDEVEFGKNYQGIYLPLSAIGTAALDCDVDFSDRKRRVCINDDRSELTKEFLTFVKLAKMRGVLFNGFDFGYLLEIARPLLPFPFTRGDADAKYGYKEDVFSTDLTRPSLRRTAAHVYGSSVGKYIEINDGVLLDIDKVAKDFVISKDEEDLSKVCCEKLDAANFSRSCESIFADVGGKKVWVNLWKELKQMRYQVYNSKTGPTF